MINKFIAKIKLLLKRLLILIVVGLAAYLLFASGTVYFTNTSNSITIGFSLSKEEPYLPADLDEQLQQSKDARLGVDELIQQARDLGVRID
jgi:hypothetical protein